VFLKEEKIFFKMFMLVFTLFALRQSSEIVLQS